MLHEQIRHVSEIEINGQSAPANCLESRRVDLQEQDQVFAGVSVFHLQKKVEFRRKG